MPADQRLRLEFSFVPDSDGEVEGERRVSFEGEISEGNLEEGGVSASGVLRGTFGMEPDQEIEASAVVETYARNGTVALITVAVRSESGRTTFSASLAPDRGADGETFSGVVFMGWPETAAAPLTAV